MITTVCRETYELSVKQSTAAVMCSVTVEQPESVIRDKTLVDTKTI